MRRLAGFVALATTLLVAVVVSPDLEPPGSLLEVGLHHGAAQRQAAEELKSLSDESAGIVGGALQQSLKGFSPQKPDKEATDMVPATAAEKQSVYKANMGSSFEDIMGHDAQHKDGKSTGVNYYGDQHTQTGWHYGGPTAHPTQSIPIRRAMGYNRMAPLGTGDLYRETHPFHSVYTMNSTDGVYHPPGFDNTYFYTMPSSPQWGDSQKRASSNGGLSGLMKSRWPKGQPGFRWKSLAHASTLKKGTRSAWPQKDNWHFQNWDAIPDPQRAHQETVGSLDPESEANLQLTYGRMYPQWAPQQKFGSINGDKFLPYSKYKTQLNVPHPKKTGTHGFRYLKGKYYEKRYKDLVRGSAIDKLDNGGWGIVDNRVPIKTAVNQQAPKWLRKVSLDPFLPALPSLSCFLLSFLPQPFLRSWSSNRYPPPFCFPPHIPKIPMRRCGQIAASQLVTHCTISGKAAALLMPAPELEDGVMWSAIKREKQVRKSVSVPVSIAISLSPGPVCPDVEIRLGYRF